LIESIWFIDAREGKGENKKMEATDEKPARLTALRVMLRDDCA
jgi:hypothetical protein